MTHNVQVGQKGVFLPCENLPNELQEKVTLHVNLLSFIK